MEENTTVMNNEDVEILDDQNPEEVSSGNPINLGIALGIATAVGGAILLGRKVVKKIKAKKQKDTEGEGAEKTEEPKKEHKGLRLGKNRELVLIDHRSNPDKDSGEQ